MADLGRVARAGPLGPVEGEPEREKGFRRCDMVRAGSMVYYCEVILSAEYELRFGAASLMHGTASIIRCDDRRAVGLLRCIMASCSGCHEIQLWK
jgi:hypothetical protein